MGGINDAVVHVVGGIDDDRRHGGQEECVRIRCNRHGDAGRHGVTGGVDVEIVVPATHHADRVAIHPGYDDHTGRPCGVGKQTASFDVVSA